MEISKVNFKNKFLIVHLIEFLELVKLIPINFNYLISLRCIYGLPSCQFSSVRIFQSSNRWTNSCKDLNIVCNWHYGVTEGLSQTAIHTYTYQSVEAISLQFYTRLHVIRSGDGMLRDLTLLCNRLRVLIDITVLHLTKPALDITCCLWQ